MLCMNVPVVCLARMIWHSYVNKVINVSADLYGCNVVNFFQEKSISQFFSSALSSPPDVSFLKMMLVNRWPCKTLFFLSFWWSSTAQLHKLFDWSRATTVHGFTLSLCFLFVVTVPSTIAQTVWLISCNMLVEYSFEFSWVEPYL